MALTDTRIRSLRSSERPYRKTDSGGLILEVKPTGARLWRYRYRIARKENMFAIGAYPEISPAITLNGIYLGLGQAFCGGIGDEVVLTLGAVKRLRDSCFLAKKEKKGGQ